MVALRKVLSSLGEDACEHHASIEHDSSAKKFIMANSPPKHLFKKYAALLEKDPFCSVCDAPCSALMEEVDVLTGGFPCKPFSNLNMHRWMPDHDPFQCEEARPFFQMSQYLKQTPNPPKIVLMEDVMGSLLKGRSGQTPAPVDFIMNGFQLEGGRKVSNGLRSLSQYVALESTIMWSNTFGLPMRRQRVFLLLLRLDVAGTCAIGGIHQNISIINNHCMTRHTLDVFVRGDIEYADASAQRVLQGARIRLAPKARLDSTVFRKRHGLPGLIQEGGTPFSCTQRIAHSEFDRREVRLLALPQDDRRRSRAVDH